MRGRCARGLDGLIYAIGGINSAGQTVGTVEAFNPSTNAWSTVTSLITPRAHHGAAVIFEDAIIVTGGVDASGNVLVSTEVFSLLSPASGWLTGAPMPTARADFGLSNGDDGFLHARREKQCHQVRIYCLERCPTIPGDPQRYVLSAYVRRAYG